MVLRTAVKVPLNAPLVGRSVMCGGVGFACAKVTGVGSDDVWSKSASPALVAVTTHVPAEVEVSCPEEMAQPEAVPLMTE